MKVRKLITCMVRNVLLAVLLIRCFLSVLRRVAEPCTRTFLVCVKLVRNDDGLWNFIHIYCIFIAILWYGTSLACLGSDTHVAKKSVHFACSVK